MRKSGIATAHLAIDVGTHSLKAIVSDGSGTIVRLIEIPHYQSDLVICPKQLWENIESILAEAAKTAKKPIIGISLSTIGEALFIPHEKWGKKFILGPNPESATLLKKISEEELGMARDPKNQFYSIFKILRKFHSIPRCPIYTVEDFIIEKLTGRRYVSPSIALRTGLYSANECNWKEDIQELGKNWQRQFARISPSGTMAGPLNEIVKTKFGVDGSVRVGAWDQVAAALGAQLPTDSILVNFGSVVSLIRWTTKRGRPTSAAKEVVQHGGRFLAVDLIYSPGIFLRKLFSHEKKYVVRESTGGQTCELPVITGVNIEEHLVYTESGPPLSIAEAMAMEFPPQLIAKWVIDETCKKIKESICGWDYKRMLLAGGGAESILVCEVFKENFSLPVVVLDNPQVSALGALTLARGEN